MELKQEESQILVGRGLKDQLLLLLLLLGRFSRV